MPYQVIYYEEISGECPIKDFINGRKERNQVKIFNLFELLEKYGPQLPRPYADLLRDGIHELRVKLLGKFSKQVQNSGTVRKRVVICKHSEKT